MRTVWHCEAQNLIDLDLDAGLVSAWAHQHDVDAHQARAADVYDTGHVRWTMKVQRPWRGHGALTDVVTDEGTIPTYELWTRLIADPPYADQLASR